MERARSNVIGLALTGAVLLAGTAIVAAAQQGGICGFMAPLPDTLMAGSFAHDAPAGYSVPPSPAGRKDQLTDEVGPDLVLAELGGTFGGIRYYGSVGEIHAYAVSTHACNFGDQRVSWIQHNNRHPVMTQGMFRLKDDRFEQIGMNWMRHGFYAVSWDFCELGCPDPTDGTALGVGCSTDCSSGLEGVQTNLSRRSDVNAHIGYFPYPWTAPDCPATIGRRLQVHQDDLDPALNEGALYFVQGHFITMSDAAAGTADNNASYRPVTVTACTPENCPRTCLGDCEHGMLAGTTGDTQRRQPAIRAWQDYDPSVIETDIRVPDEGLFILAGKATGLGNGTWRYAYAIENLNSDRSARSFSVPLPRGAVVANIGFHDVDYHSGEIYDLTDWPATVTDDAITWSTEMYAANPNANALRFSTLYNFYFTVNAAPYDTMVTLGLFKPGEPSVVTATFIGPRTFASDCNANGISDYCDLDCSLEDCEWPCGGSIDCNGNGVPDECEPDCNDNGAADECDILDCDGALWCNDCNHNGIPDGCEPDCDGNGIPDDFVPPPDTDGDGVNDCVDQCPLNTPPNTCNCPPFVECCWGTYCLPNYDPLECIELLGTPACLTAPCRDGCLLGDVDRDGDLDLYDFRALQNSYSGAAGEPGFVEPPEEYLLMFDVHEDGDIDLADYKSFGFFMSGP